MRSDSAIIYMPFSHKYPAPLYIAFVCVFYGRQWTVEIAHNFINTSYANA